MGAGMAKMKASLKCDRMDVHGDMPPTPREAHSMVELDGQRVLIFGGGGCNSSQPYQQLNDAFILHTKQGKWTKAVTKGVSPSPRTGQAAVALPDGRVMFIGGCSMTEGYTDDIYILDTVTWDWQGVTPTGTSPSPRDKHTACYFAGKVYVFGGFGPQVEEDEGDEESDDDKSIEDEEEGGEDEGSDSEGEDEEESHTGLSFTWFNDLHVFDVEKLTWSKVETRGDVPTPRAAHAAFVSQGSEDTARMVVFGGRDPDGRQNDLYSLHLSTLVWKLEKQGDPSFGVSSTPDSTAAPAARSFHTLTPVPGVPLAILYGGIGTTNEQFNSVEVLNTDTMRWALVSELEGVWPSPRSGTSAASLQPAVFGGEGGQNGLGVSGSKRTAIGAPKMVIFGGSSIVEGSDPLYHNDVFSVDLEPLILAHSANTIAPP